MEELNLSRVIVTNILKGVTVIGINILIGMLIIGTIKIIDIGLSIVGTTHIEKDPRGFVI